VCRVSSARRPWPNKIVVEVYDQLADTRAIGASCRRGAVTDESASPFAAFFFGASASVHTIGPPG